MSGGDIRRRPSINSGCLRPTAIIFPLLSDFTLTPRSLSAVIVERLPSDQTGRLRASAIILAPVSGFASAVGISSVGRRRKWVLASLGHHPPSAKWLCISGADIKCRPSNNSGCLRAAALVGE